MTTRNKKKDSDSSSTTNASGGYSPDALMSMLASQGYGQQGKGRHKEGWQPTVVPLQPNGVPSVQTQLAGTYNFNTVAPQYIAPGYEHLEDVAKQRDLEGNQNKSVWDKFRGSLNDINLGDANPKYNQIMDNVKLATNKHDADLREGRWSDNAGLITDFTSDIVDKKGLGAAMKALGQKAAFDEDLKELSSKYDEKTNTGGIPPHAIEFYKNAGKFSDPVFDENGNLINTLSYSAPEIFTARNLPNEVNEWVTKMASNKDYKVDADGNKMFPVGDLGIQFGLASTEYRSEADIRAMAENYVYGSGGKEYLTREAEIKAFNQLKGFDSSNPEHVKMIQDVVNSAAATETDEGEFTKMQKLDPSVLAANAKQILGKVHYNALTESIVKGATALGAYKKEDFEFVTNEQEKMALEHKYKMAEDQAKADREAAAKDEDIIPYTLSVGSAIVVQKVDTASSAYVADRIAKINAELPQLNIDLARFEKENKNHATNAGYAAAVEKRAALEAEITQLRNTSELTTRPFINILAGKKKSLGQMFTLYQKSHPDNKMTQQEFFLNFAHDVMNEIQGGRSAKRLKDGVVLNGNREDGNFKGYTVFNNSPYSPSSSATGSMDKVVKDVAKEWMKKNPGKVSLDITNNTAIFKGVNGETAKFPGATSYANYQKELNANAKNLKGLIVSAAGFENKQMNPVEYLAESLGIDDATAGLITSEATMYPAPYSIGAARANKQMMYYVEIPIKTDENNKVATKLRDKVGNNVITIPVSFSGNHGRIMEEQGRKALTDLLNEVRKNNIGKSPEMQTTLNNLYLNQANFSNLGKEFDTYNVYNLDGSYNAPLRPNSKLTTSQKLINAFNTEILITAQNDVNSVSKFDKSFTMRPTINGERYVMLVDKDGDPTERIQVTEKAFNAMPAKEKNKYVEYAFDTDSDMKAFLAQNQFDYNDYLKSFNKGGGGQGKTSSYGNSKDWVRANAPTYKTTLIKNGKNVVHNAYVPGDELSSLMGTGIKMTSNAGIPYVHESVKNNLVRVMKQYDLLMTGGLRTKEHTVSGGAKNSKHFLGKGIDIQDDANGMAFYNKLVNNKKLQQQMGIAWIDRHDKGSGMHIHLEMLGAETKATATAKYATPSSAASSIMNALAMGESSNRNIGYHYEDKDSNSSAFGKFGFTDEWFKKMSSHYNMPESTIRKRPDLIENYAKTVYFETAKSEILPIFDKLKARVRGYMPDFTMQEAIFAYHYAGGNVLKDIANGKATIMTVPRRDKGNTQTIFKYINNRKQYL